MDFCKILEDNLKNETTPTLKTNAKRRATQKWRRPQQRRWPQKWRQPKDVDDPKNVHNPEISGNLKNEEVLKNCEDKDDNIMSSRVENKMIFVKSLTKTFYSA